MALILSIESSLDVGSVALHNQGTLIDITHLGEPRQHASSLAPEIKKLLLKQNIKFDQLDAFAVAMGPGSYTGLRIGVSITKALCYALSKPLIAINTLDIMAFAAINQYNEKILYCPLIDARRMEVYFKLVDFELAEIIPTTAQVIDADFLADVLTNREVYFFGDGSSKVRKVVQNNKAKYADNIMPDADSLGELAY
ncbi:MAG TPA: tRNA (adenosine(37)-N6)-threonylcarbamoyltransferase complex dimerization subunit type 1 TsaB, partial [Cyclobacteriaceae bacterium]|nr:tRNA (adenosine(37)-N6)-threonylcarbamoyltransferase complex dimerization subunit type 1 TsaB [Cyclobacteriaceae bacterium]